MPQEPQRWATGCRTSWAWWKPVQTPGYRSGLRGRILVRAPHSALLLETEWLPGERVHTKGGTRGRARGSWVPGEVLHMRHAIAPLWARRMHRPLAAMACHVPASPLP